jgi:hypothetical protein
MAKVSIHAPTWGATPLLWKLQADQGSFNPRAHVGRDAIPLQGELGLRGCFNPRAHVGRDCLTLTHVYRET